ncbi:MAG: HNH endonuclease, partial [Bryobacterales bacterium]|nr:HNH endonuclease [Bryobacterales bacterium]
ERDAETGLDYFGARYMSSAQGRFTSPDKPFADQHIENPQSWNLYTYTLNNPLRYVDPNGEGVLEGAARWVDRTGGAFVSLVLAPEKTIPAAASNVWNAVTHPSETLSAIGTGLKNFANASLDDKITTLTEVGLDAGVAVMTGGASKATSVTELGIAGAETVVKTGTGSAIVSGMTKVGEAGGPGAGKPFANSVKDAARAESGNTCVFCSQPTTRTAGPSQSNIDHAIPKSRQGNNTLNNAQNTCRTCNLDKATRTTKEYEEELRRRSGGN